MRKLSKTLTFLVLLSSSMSCKPSGGGGAVTLGGINSEQAKRKIVPLPDLSGVTSLVVLDFAGDISLDSINGYVVGFPDNLKIEATTGNKFFIKNVPDGDHSILVTGKSVAGDDIGILLNRVRALKGTANELTALTLSKLVELEAAAIDIATGKSISACELNLIGTKIKGNCADEGRLRIGNIPFGKYNMEVSAVGFATGIWRNFEVSQTDKLTILNLLNSEAARRSLLLAQGPFKLEDPFRLIMLTPPIIPANESWEEMKVAVNSNFDYTDWEPLRTSFLRKVITKSGDNKISIKLRTKSGAESAQLFTSIYFDGPIDNSVQKGSFDFVQPSRDLRQVRVKQGSKGITDDFKLTSKGVVDIVVVVDNSGFMDSEQSNLSSRLTPLLSSIKDSDWRIMVTTTDASTKCENSVISKGDFNPESRFQSIVKNAGTNGSSLERPILKAAVALNCRSWNLSTVAQSWLRPGSTVAVLILTDEDNCHGDIAQGYGCAGQADKEGAYLINYLSSIRQVGTDAKVYGIFWHPSQTQAQCLSARKQANIIADVVEKTGGTWGSICDSDYSGTLTRISQDVAKILKADFTLKSIPDSGTFQMTVDGQSWTDYVLTGVNVLFTRNPPPGAAIAVRYISGGSGVVTNTFDIPDEPADGKISATVNGQPVQDIVYDSTDRQVVFSSPPPANSDIVLTYKANTPLKTKFSLPENSNAQAVRVFLNGGLVSASKYVYDSKNQVLNFLSPPPEGTTITVEW